ncbi:NAD-dependent epimerase/dehydratase family protein, partial [Paracoccaceae bacterium]|nr:NAD-dependent epimerase/dehydratase family protein [Paracoccaceae bacterium]
MVNILVTGGAGYVGSHACKALKAVGYTPVTFDNLSSGWRDAVQFGPFVFGDINSPSCLKNAFQQYQPQAICHFAALSDISESQHQPAQYWLTNVMGSLNLLQAAQLNGCNNII